MVLREPCSIPLTHSHTTQLWEWKKTSFPLDTTHSLPGLTPPTGAITWCVWQKNKHLIKTNTAQSTPIMNKDLNLGWVEYETKEP